MTLSGIEPATFRFVEQHLNHCATAVPVELHVAVLNKRRDYRKSLYEDDILHRFFDMNGFFVNTVMNLRYL
jgi:hypothetical protein